MRALLCWWEIHPIDGGAWHTDGMPLSWDAASRFRAPQLRNPPTTYVFFPVALRHVHGLLNW